jgi:hypothetical protein
MQAGLVSNDEPLRLAPLSRYAAESLVAESRVGPALAQAGIEPTALIDTLIRAAQLAAEHVEISSLDLNPVITTRDGCFVTDAVVTVAPLDHPAGALRRL